MSTASISPARPSRAQVTVWDRLAVALLGAIGFALSYDALQQMAVAIHVRGWLTYMFPLTIDGFIAYGVRALLVLREAPWPARAYAWLLFAGATGASVWANALHAVRLNHLAEVGGGLRLGDSVVGLLSTLAPLALGGSVHLYILIARHSLATVPPTSGGLQRAAEGPDSLDRPESLVEPFADMDRQTHAAASAEDAGPATAEAGAAPADLFVHWSPDGAGNGPADGAAAEHTRAGDQAEPQWSADQPAAGAFDVPPVPAVSEEVVGSPEADPGSVDHARAGDSVDGVAGEVAGQGISGQSGQSEGARSAGRPPGAPTEELVAIGREGWTVAGRLTRHVVRDAIRARNLTVSEDRVTEVANILRAERDAAGGLRA
ncbi:DUF2637 domain-containing protein [Kitasatospora azatica]|uniref:DUF2637 domain-containing protein n=1 Tax=Kitasatospora azatica TaxID=58347 RepID=UPI0005681EE3|nr:DUF2637 domain-containing protein [Kitasatospora azatica]